MMRATSGITVETQGADRQAFRRNVSLFATGVVVISCADELGGHVHGMTVNSFTSLSLDPPTVIVSLKAGRAHELIGKSGRFGASVLNEAQQMYSNHFSGMRDTGLAPEFAVRERVHTLADCLAWFECEVTRAIDIHDHTLFVARVTACGGQEGSPLMFFASRYHFPSIAGE